MPIMNIFKLNLHLMYFLLTFFSNTNMFLEFLHTCKHSVYKICILLPSFNMVV